MKMISPLELRRLLTSEQEFALLDVREQGAFSQSHLLFAVCVPLSRLELMIADLVPRADSHLVIVDDCAGEKLGTRAIVRLAELGYGNAVLLDGGVEAWRAAGMELFSGINVPSKAFGEFVEQAYETPRLAAAEVKAMLDEGRDMVIVDSRPFEEFHRMNIPSATNMPGAELAFRIHDLAPNPETFVVVNCAGRTRSIIGAQSLINAGIPNPVAALKDGTMGWHLAGFELETGGTREAQQPSATGMEKALAAAACVAERFEVATITPEAVAIRLKDASRTTYLLDVRSPTEYAEGHLPGYLNAPGGQLVQATDEYVAVKNATLILADDADVRATMTASWLIQMGWRNVFVLEGGVGSGCLESGKPLPAILTKMVPGDSTITTEDLAADLKTFTVIDVSPSPIYERRHIPGAFWTVRARLALALSVLPPAARIVLTSPDGLLACVALAEARALTGCEVLVLDGGTDRWMAAGRPIETGLEHAIGAIDDVWYKPYEHREAQEKFMREYLTWEVALVEQIERDGTTRFRSY